MMMTTTTMVMIPLMLITTTMVFVLICHSYSVSKSYFHQKLVSLVGYKCRVSDLYHIFVSIIITFVMFFIYIFYLMFIYFEGSNIKPLLVNVFLYPK